MELKLNIQPNLYVNDLVEQIWKLK
jgi:hypothetical protein